MANYHDHLVACDSSMTPLETGFLQQLGISYLREVEALSIFVFFYGASPSLVVQNGSPIGSLKGVFAVLFFASIVILAFVFSFLRVAYF